MQKLKDNPNLMNWNNLEKSIQFYFQVVLEDPQMQKILNIYNGDALKYEIFHSVFTKRKTKFCYNINKWT